MTVWFVSCIGMNSEVETCKWHDKASARQAVMDLLEDGFSEDDIRVYRGEEIDFTAQTRVTVDNVEFVEISK